MRLDAWLRQDPSVVERLQLVERLALAVNAAHARGQLFGALQPSRIEVGGNGDCHLDDAIQGMPTAEYRAPERDVSAPSSAPADVFAAGAVVWEVLARRPYAASPSHLADTRADVPRDLADAVMACLEQSPEWRPRDLVYVAQLAQQAAAQRGGATRPSRPAATKTAPPRAERAKKPAARPAGRPTLEFGAGAGEDGGRSRVPLLLGGLVLVAAAAGGYYWTTRGSEAPTAAAAVPQPIAPTSATAAPTVAAPSATPDATAQAAEPVPTATPLAAPAPAPTPRPTPTPTPTAPAAAAVSRPPAPEPAVAVAAPTTSAPASTAPAPAAAAPASAAASEPAPAPPPPRERAELSTLSPLSVKRPGRVLFDLRGTGLAADLHARLIAVREAPRGLSVVREKCSGTLCNVLVQLDDSVKPAAYAIVLADPQSIQTNALTFTVTR